jgi:hypothetical protein
LGPILVGRLVTLENFLHGVLIAILEPSFNTPATVESVMLNILKPKNTEQIVILAEDFYAIVLDTPMEKLVIKQESKLAFALNVKMMLGAILAGGFMIIMVEITHSAMFVAKWFPIILFQM